ncbi:hypothetical protein Goe27_00310 [Bacillus phage vB_BsuM-Goe27]|nr:hypothetical protein [Bacillus phage BM-P1]WCS69914.1 hypothetical protein Goe27_00310 [Bacillus phage vB_BsuM-Goe27]
MENSKYVYDIDFGKFGIKADCTEAAATTEGFITALEDAVDQGYPKVYIPGGFYLIDAVGTSGKLPEFGGGLRFPSNIEVIFHEKAVFIVDPNDATGYACFNLENVENVTLRGGVVIGDRYKHTYVQEGVPDNRKTHEWGYGLQIRGCRNIKVENMTLMDATGDNIWVPAKGMMHWEGSTYIPSEGITIEKCYTLRGRRNNLATNGCLGLNINDCDFVEAGGDTIGPAYGIDLEGFAENSIKYDHPYEINVTNCRFKRNGKGALTINVAGKAHATNNFSDDIISYGFSTDATISNNTITNESEELKEYGIDSIRKSSSETGNRAIITGNHIRGFKSGICARGVGVVASNNYLENISSVGIYAYLAENVLMADNVINSDCLHVWVRESNDVKISNSKGKGAINNWGIKVEASSNVSLNDNEHSSKGGVQVARSTDVRAWDNRFTLVGNEYGAYWDKTSEVRVFEGNHIFNPSTIAIAGYGDTYASSIVRNTIHDCKYLTAIYLSGGSQHFVKGNDIRFRRGANGGYGIKLTGTSGVKVIGNDVRTMDGCSLNASYDSSGSVNTQYANNTYHTGRMLLHDSDTSSGDVKFSS